MSDEETTDEEPSGGSAGLRAGVSLASHTVGRVSSLFFLLISRGSTPSNPPRLAVFGHTPYLSTDSL